MLGRAERVRRFPCPESLVRDTAGAEIVEFAVSLPLLVVVLVGIFDFGTAFNVKHKLDNAALQGARVASNQPTNDLSSAGTPPCSAPESICVVRDIVDTTMTRSKLNDCGLGAAAGTLGPALTWTFTANTGCPGTLTLTIERGFWYDTTLPSPPFQANYRIEATRVTLSYPYRWQFNRAIGLVAPGASYPGISQLISVASMQNLN